MLSQSFLAASSASSSLLSLGACSLLHAPVMRAEVVTRHALGSAARSAIAAIFAVGLIGCATLTGRRFGRDVADARITAEIQETFAAENLPALAQIHIRTRHGVVSLNGTVDSEMERLRAAELARHALGVHKVANNLKVRSSG